MSQDKPSWLTELESRVAASMAIGTGSLCEIELTDVQVRAAKAEINRRLRGGCDQ